MSEIINELKALEVKYGITYKDVRLVGKQGLFTYERGVRQTKSERISGAIPLVTAGYEKTGIAEFINSGKSKLFDENTLTIDMFGNAFYRNYKYYADDNIISLQNKEFGKNPLLYVASCLVYLRKMFNYGKQFRIKELKSIIISLPHEPDGTLAIGFMEEFIATLERKRLATLDAYLSVKGWTTEDLGEKSEIQNQLTNLLENREIKWKDVKMSELFEIVNHTTIDKSSFKNNSTSTIGKYPYRTRTILNNGIEGYTDKELEYAKIEGKCIFVGMLGRKFFYEPNTFYAGQFTKSIYPKFEGFNKSVALYFIANFNKYHDAHVGLAVRYFNTTFYTHEISLPHTPDGNLDLEFMKEFIELIEKLKIHNVANELQTRINLTESII